jgi:outer membrane protein, multidrug efflux system
MQARANWASLGAAAMLWLVAGCRSVGSDYVEPDIEVPASWQESLAAGVRASPEAEPQWWRQLGDPTLDALIESGWRDSLDLRDALSRVREARARRGVAAAADLPVVDARAAFERLADSDNTPFGVFVPDYDTTSLGFDASWELDLWGRLARSTEAADAELGASVENARDVVITLAAELAREYVELRAFQRRVAIAQRNVELQRETLALVQARFDAGLVGERDLAQARTIVESTRARVPSLESGVQAARNRIAVLLGCAPGTLPADLAARLAESAPVPVPPRGIAIGVPADLLRRRPDLRRAERVLAAEHARIGVAEAELYPRLSLSGRLGLAAEHVDDLFDGDSTALAFGPTLRWNVFDRARLRGNVAAQTERVEQARAQWEHGVLRALEESENALGSFAREQQRRDALLEAARQARRAVEYSQTQYREGLTDFQAVLDSQRTVAGLEDELALSDAAVTTDLIALYKALGGGWEDMRAGRSEDAPLAGAAPR